MITKYNINGEPYLDASDVFKDIKSQLTFGKMCRHLRECEEIAQFELASRLGISKQSLSDIEHDRKQVGLDFIKKFSAELGLSPEPLIELYFLDMLKKHGLKFKVSIKKAS